MDKITQNLVTKSTESFLMGLEIYNKPTIKYRIEGFSFFICNAWELMLKAELINRKKSIYYKNNPSRTLSLSTTIREIYSDKNTRIRQNLELIVKLRNTSTHYITEDYETKYAPLFQACVINYSKELSRFHSVNITDLIPLNFLTITTNYAPLSNEQIKVKYPPEIAEKLIQEANKIDVLTEEYNSEHFSIGIKQNLYITKDASKADFTIAVKNSSKNDVAIVKELKDPSNTHKYSYNTVIKIIQDRLNKKNIKLGYKNGFNEYVLNLFIQFYNIKQDKKYSYQHIIGKQKHFTYSQQLIEFILEQINKNPDNFVESLKK